MSINKEAILKIMPDCFLTVIGTEVEYTPYKTDDSSTDVGPRLTLIRSGHVNR